MQKITEKAIKNAKKVANDKINVHVAFLKELKTTADVISASLEGVTDKFGIAINNIDFDHLISFRLTIIFHK